MDNTADIKKEIKEEDIKKEVVDISKEAIDVSKESICTLKEENKDETELKDDDLPEGFFDDFSDKEFMDGLNVLDEWDENQKSVDSDKQKVEESNIRETVSPSRKQQFKNRYYRVRNNSLERCGNSVDHNSPERDRRNVYPSRRSPRYRGSPRRGRSPCRGESPRRGRYYYTAPRKNRDRSNSYDRRDRSRDRNRRSRSRGRRSWSRDRKTRSPDIRYRREVGKSRYSNDKKKPEEEELRRDPDKTRQDIQKDKDKCQRIQEAREVEKKIQVAESGLCPPGMEDMLDEVEAAKIFAISSKEEATLIVNKEMEGPKKIKLNLIPRETSDSTRDKKNSLKRTLNVQHIHTEELKNSDSDTPSNDNRRSISPNLNIKNKRRSISPLKFIRRSISPTYKNRDGSNCKFRYNQGNSPDFTKDVSISPVPLKFMQRSISPRCKDRYSSRGKSRSISPRYKDRYGSRGKSRYKPGNSRDFVRNFSISPEPEFTRRSVSPRYKDRYGPSCQSRYNTGKTSDYSISPEPKRKKFIDEITRTLQRAVPAVDGKSNVTQISYSQNFNVQFGAPVDMRPAPVDMVSQPFVPSNVPAICGDSNQFNNFPQQFGAQPMAFPSQDLQQALPYLQSPSMPMGSDFSSPFQQNFQSTIMESVPLSTELNQPTFDTVIPHPQANFPNQETVSFSQSVTSTVPSKVVQNRVPITDLKLNTQQLSKSQGRQQSLPYTQSLSMPMGSDFSAPFQQNFQSTVISVPISTELTQSVFGATNSDKQVHFPNKKATSVSKSATSTTSTLSSRSVQNQDLKLKTQQLSKLFEDKKISLSDFLTISAKGESSSNNDVQEKIKVISRCQEALKLLDNPHNLSGIFTPKLSPVSSMGHEKSMQVKYRSPLKRTAVVKFNFTSKGKKNDLQITMNRLLSNVGVTSIELTPPPPPRIASTQASTTKIDFISPHSPTYELVHQAIQTDPPVCQICELRKATKYTDTAVQTVPMKTINKAIQLSGTEFGLPRSSLVKKQSITHLTAAQLREQEAHSKMEVSAEPPICNPFNGGWMKTPNVWSTNSTPNNPINISNPSWAPQQAAWSQNQQSPNKSGNNTKPIEGKIERQQALPQGTPFRKRKRNRNRGRKNVQVEKNSDSGGNSNNKPKVN